VRLAPTYKVFSAAIAATVTCLPDLGQAQQFAIDPQIENQVDSEPPLASDTDGLILEGLRLFTEESFGGNGRTCATCHPVTNNFTIDKEFIATLPDDDPLFIAENVPRLSRLENKALMREFGLILENLDGFKNPGVMRGVPHTLGMRTSIQADRGDPGSNRPPFPLVHMTGWSGDGAPADGSIKNFALGAVTQHATAGMPRRGCSTDEFDRNPNPCDFRIPTDAELDAMAAFQLFLGRQSEINLAAMNFADPFGTASNDDNDINKGRDLFNGVEGRRACSGCHHNAGANDAQGNGRNFATGTNRHPNAPTCRQRQAPGDGGFGLEPSTVRRSEICGRGHTGNAQFLGDGTFNTVSLIEAADTGPFFHNNIVETIEEAVAFYTSDVFAASPAGAFGDFDLDEEEVLQIAALLRTLNALANIQFSDRLDRIAQRQAATRPDLALLAVEMAIAETEDASEVLRGSELGPLYQGAIDLLDQAMDREQQAINQRDPALLAQAISLKNRAQGMILP
jgi:cytochrome c peroxidase